MFPPARGRQALQLLGHALARNWQQPVRSRVLPTSTREGTWPREAAPCAGAFFAKGPPASQPDAKLSGAAGAYASSWAFLGLCRVPLSGEGIGFVFNHPVA